MHSDFGVTLITSIKVFNNFCSISLASSSKCSRDQSPEPWTTQQSNLSAVTLDYSNIKKRIWMIRTRSARLRTIPSYPRHWTSIHKGPVKTDILSVLECEHECPTRIDRHFVLNLRVELVVHAFQQLFGLWRGTGQHYALKCTQVLVGGKLMTWSCRSSVKTDTCHHMYRTILL